MSNNGEEFEKYVYQRLKRNGIVAVKDVNLVIPSPSQIDCMLFCNNRVYVIECKDLSAEIEDTKSTSPYWILNYDKTRYTYYNPVLQNISHIKKVMKNIPYDLKPTSYENIVVIGDKAQFETTDVVMSLEDLIKKLGVVQTTPEDIRRSKLIGLIKFDNILEHQLIVDNVRRKRGWK